jgi:hypothetical protein
MKGFKNCQQGHWFKEDLAQCPYCPSNQPGGPNNPTSNDFDKTQVGGISPGGGGGASSGGAGYGDRTQTVGSGDNSRTIPNSSKPTGAKNFDRTFIGGVTSTETSENGEPNVVEPPRKTRKIVGWLVSFTLDPMGVDYRIYEGRNTIGRDVSNTITITKDTTISSKHAVILYRDTQGFFIQDEMSANGTYVNGEELEIGKAFSIKDGDEIKMAKTVFKFKSCK